MDERPTHTNLRLTTASDCLVLMEGVRRNLLRLVTRRLTDAERSMYIKPGSVFVWQEGKCRAQSLPRPLFTFSIACDLAVTRCQQNCSRWTDGLAWGPSRMREPFLFYDEKPASSSTPGTDALDPSNRSGSSARGRAAPYDRGPKPSTKNTYGGLVKQTFSTLVRMNDETSVKWHVVAYFTTDSHPSIPGVRDDPILKDVEVPPGVYESARQRKPGTTNPRGPPFKERPSIKSESSEGMSSPLPSPVPPRRYSTQTGMPGLASPTGSFSYGLPSPASAPDLTSMYQKRPPNTYSPPPHPGSSMTWSPKYQEDMASQFAFSPQLMSHFPFQPDNDFGSLSETLHVATFRPVVNPGGAPPPFSQSEPPRTLEAFHYFQQQLSSARHFALLRPLTVDDHLVFYGPSLFPTVEISSLYDDFALNRRPANRDFLGAYFSPSTNYDGHFDQPFSINLREPIRQGQNKWAQVWRASLRCALGGGGWTQGLPVVVKLFQESLFPPPTSDDLLGDKSECGWYSMRDQAEAEAWAYDLLKIHQGRLCPYSYGMYEFSLPCGEGRVIGHVMEDVNSWTLDEYIQGIGGEMNIQGTWEIATASVDGLEAIHASGVAHRDLKPRHVLVPKERPGTVVFVDFTYSAGDGPADSQPLYDTLRESGFVNGIDKWVTATGGHTRLVDPPLLLPATTSTPGAPQF